MLAVTHNPRLPHDAELAKAEVWLEADGAGFAVALIAVLEDGMRLLAGTVAGCGDQPSAMEAADQMVRKTKLGRAFVSYHWGRPALVPVQVNPDVCPTCRRVA